MQKILGLDIGSYSLKAVLLKNLGSNYEIDTCIEILFKQDLQESLRTAQLRALKELHAQIGFDQESVYAALDSSVVVSRKFSFMNVTKRHLPRLLSHELDNNTLLETENSAFTYTLFYHTDKQSDIIAAVVKKNDLRTIVDLLSEAQWHVRIIDVEAATFSNLAPFFLNTTNSISSISHANKTTSIDSLHLNIAEAYNIDLIITMGHKKTTLSLIANNHKIFYFASLQIAGQAFTRALQKEYLLSFEEAETKKHIIEIKNESSLQILVTDLCLEISRILKNIIVKENIKIQRVYLTGGSAQLKGVDTFIADKLKLTIEKIPFPNNLLRTNSTESLKPENWGNFAQATSIALRGTYLRSNSKFNFRKGEFALSSNYEKTIEQLFKYAKIIAFVFVCLLISCLFRYLLYSNKIELLQSVFKTEINTLIGSEPSELRLLELEDVPFSVYSNKAIEILNQNLQFKKQMVSNFAANKSPMIIDILNQISLSIPKSIYFEIAKIKINNQTLYIDADTNNQNSIDQIIKNLSSTESLKNIQKTAQGNKLDSNNKLIRFSFTAQIVYGS